MNTTQGLNSIIIIVIQEMKDFGSLTVISVEYCCKVNPAWFTFTFNHLAEAFIQSDLQMRTIEAIKTKNVQCLKMTNS